MKILILKDKTINNTLLGQVELQIKTVYKELGIEFIHQDFDYSTYPVSEYFNGFYGISHSWLQVECAKVYKRYAEEVDQVVFLIASDNWKLDDASVPSGKGVWGWNMSGRFNGYGVQQVRFAQRKDHSDARNVNNSAGTLYHELHHDHDTYIFVNTGDVIENVVGVKDWDNDVTHGGSPDWPYIRTTKDGTKSVDMIMPLLKKARNTRKVVWLTKKVGLLQQIHRLMVQLRSLQASVRGDVPILENNKCVCFRK
jgi:hypothetical protein